MKRLLFGFLFCLSVAVPAVAQQNEFRRFEINFNPLGYGHHLDQSWGVGKLSFAFHPGPQWALVSELTLHVTNNDALEEVLTLYRFGPRYTVSHGDRLTYFGHFLVGGARTTTTLKSSAGSFSVGNNGFSLEAGGGLDVGIRPWFAIRAVDVNYSFVHFGYNSTSSSGFNVGGGIVFRFGQ